VYYAAITSEGRGSVHSVTGMRDPLVTYRLTRRDRELLRSGLCRLALLMLAAGADEVYPSFHNAPVVRRTADIAAVQDAFASSKAPVMTVHMCASTPLGEHPRWPPTATAGAGCATCGSTTPRCSRARRASARGAR
jgi:hypothetical protein